MAADNFVKGKEINSIKLDFWKQQENYLDLKSEVIKAQKTARERLESEINDNCKL
jgi:hypothetical protein